jgi:hypothetical protein
VPSPPEQPEQQDDLADVPLGQELALCVGDRRERMRARDERPPEKANNTLAERIAATTPPNPTTLAVSANDSPLSRRSRTHLRGVNRPACAHAGRASRRTGSNVCGFRYRIVLFLSWGAGGPGTGTAKAGEAFAAVKRLRLANESAARENTQQAIAAMAALTL